MLSIRNLGVRTGNFAATVCQREISLGSKGAKGTWKMGKEGVLRHVKTIQTPLREAVETVGCVASATVAVGSTILQAGILSISVATVINAPVERLTGVDLLGKIEVLIPRNDN